ncbi:hypothetical protein BX600DRAFT_59174 [Xylariales sp. PMI_506]|nr:hypothetical protein BX600DRAFT_59174 [Xylariales sp. PMI_506]
MDYTMWTQALFFNSPEARRISYAAQIRVLRAFQIAIKQGTINNALIACVTGFNCRAVPRDTGEWGPILGLFQSVGIETLGGLEQSGYVVPDLDHFAVYRNLLRTNPDLSTRDPGLVEFHNRINIRGSALDFKPPALPLCQSYQNTHLLGMVPNRPPRTAVECFAVDPEFQDLLLDLKYTLHVLEQYLVEREAGLEQLYPGRFVNFRDIIQHGVYSLPLRQIAANQHAATEVCRLAVLVFTLGVTQPHPLRSVHQRATDQLSRALGNPRLTGNQSLGFLFWAAMVGALGAGLDDPVTAGPAGFYHERMVSLATKLRLRKWDEVKLLLQGFLWFDRSCDKGGRVLWDRVRKARQLRT